MNITFLISLIPVALFLMITPYLTRRTESFGVSIPADAYKHEDLVKMRKQYAWTILLCTLVAVAIILFFNSNGAVVFLMTLIAYVIVSFLIYLVFHHRMKKYKASQDWYNMRKQTLVVDTNFRSKPVTFSIGWFAIPFLIAVVTLLLSLIFYDKIPGKIPTHFGIDGQPDHWSIKSYRTVLMFPILQIMMILLFAFINSMIGWSKSVIEAQSPNESSQKNQMFRRRWSGFTIFMGTLIVIMMGLDQFTFFLSVKPVVLSLINFVPLGIILITLIILAVTTGQGGSRIKLKGEQNAAVINRDDDRHWKLGVFYVNREDPSLFVEKRFGIGWTPNLAHPVSYLSLFGIIILVILASVFLT
ncbi:DUF1648 domain-containing protein [Camelliibacillus cellulosilyticus]